MGTNIHSAFGGNFTSNPQGVANVLKDIGFRYVRDVPTTPDRLNALTAATGVKVCAISQYYWYGSDAFDTKNFDALWTQVKQVNNIAYLELPNEPQNFDDYNDKLHAWTIQLYQAAKADLRLSAVPLVASSVYGPTPGLADLSPYLDYGNIHDYPDVHNPAVNIAVNVSHARTVTGDKPIIATETGYHNAWQSPSYFTGASEIASAKYLPRLYLQHFNYGIVKTFNYELIESFVDDTFTNGEAHFGLVRTDLSYKPAAYALKNLISLLKDPGPDFTPSSLNYTITTASPDVQHTLLQKRDGTFWLGLWQNVLSYDPAARQDLIVPPVNVGLSFNGVPLVRAETYLPTTSTDVKNTASAAQLVNLAIDDQVTLVHLRLAAPGDTNADGLINDADVATFFHHYGQAVTPNGGWALGDFDRDGEVGFIDFQLMELNYGRAQYSPELQAQAAAIIAASVPEPGAALAVLACVGLFARRCRRR
ncbi:MAG: hypothetical protein JWN40_5718 [Phycisphaerales bacterium]|nr:hypothetical protein [Phycisphaerales bacterium]